MQADAEGLPGGWAWAPLGEITTAIGGGTPDTRETRYWDGGTVPWVSPKDMKSFDIRDSIDKLTESALERLSLVPADSVLVVVRSGILSRTLPVAVNRVPVTINQDMRAFRPGIGIDPRFLALQLVAHERQILDACAKDGTTVASIEGPRLAAFRLALPPHREQARIVAKLDEALSDLDGAIVELTGAQKKLALYRQSLLKSGVEGTLTADWRAQNPPKETGAELLARILRERRALWEARQLDKFKAQGKTPPARRSANYPEPAYAEVEPGHHLPEGWTWATIDQLAYVGTGVTPLRSKRQYFDGGHIPWVTSGALNAEVVTSASEQVTDTALAECRLELYPAGALLVAMYGEGKTRGKCSELGIPATINQAIAALVFNGLAAECRDFVKAFLWDSYERMREQASGGVQPNLNLQIIKNLIVPLPPLHEQARIVAAIAEQSEAVQTQREAISRGVRLATAQRQNILRAAFSGQLVPQDPNDEPASVLLDRIRAHRSAAGDKLAARRPRKASTAA